MLAGIGTLTIVDHAEVREEDLGAQFFISADNLNQNVCLLPSPDTNHLLRLITPFLLESGGRRASNKAIKPAGSTQRRHVEY